MLWRRRVAKPVPPALPPVMFIGDSITFSWRQLSDHPGLVNRGVPTETTRDIAARFEAEVLKTGAAGVHILAGVNDVAGNGGEIALKETCFNLRALAGRAKAGGLRVWLASVLPVDGVWWAPAVRHPHITVVALNRRLRADARALGVDYVDYHQTMAAPSGRLRPEFSADGVHLSPAGYAAITPLALAALGWS